MSIHGRRNSSGSVVVKDGYKRTFDLVIISAAIVLLFPFWLILLIAIPVAIWLEDRGPILYIQTRIGLGGRCYRMFKFRTRQGVDYPATSLSYEEPQSTVVGNVLRKYHLDEIPQLVNIVRGDMSLVGPRPERVVRHRQICRQLPEFAQRLRVKPGIAGLAQVRGNYWLSPRRKLKYDNLYIKTLSPWMDVKLLFLSVRFVIKRELGTPFQRQTHYAEIDPDTSV